MPLALLLLLSLSSVPGQRPPVQETTLDRLRALVVQSSPTACIRRDALEVLSTLMTLAKHHRVSNFRIEATEPAAQALRKGRSVFRLSMSASFPALMQFLDDLRQLKAPTTVDHLSLHVVEGGGLKVSFRLVLYEDLQRVLEHRAAP
jgi:hypothetical protein